MDEDEHVAAQHSGGVLAFDDLADHLADPIVGRHGPFRIERRPIAIFEFQECRRARAVGEGPVADCPDGNQVIGHRFRPPSA
jgi:hypothetical protein